MRVILLLLLAINDTNQSWQIDKGLLKSFGVDSICVGRAGRTARPISKGVIGVDIGSTAQIVKMIQIFDDL